MKIFLYPKEEKKAFRMHRFFAKIIDWFLFMIAFALFGLLELHFWQIFLFFVYSFLLPAFDLQTVGQLICSIQFQSKSKNKFWISFLHQFSLFMLFYLIILQFLFGFQPLHQKIASSYYTRKI